MHAMRPAAGSSDRSHRSAPQALAAPRILKIRGIIRRCLRLPNTFGLVGVAREPASLF